MNGWILFISKIEICVAMGLGAFSAITGKLRKLAAGVLIFEIISNIVSVIWAVITVRSLSDSWSETWKYFKDNFQKPFGPLDYSDYEKEIDAKNYQIKALTEERTENLRQLLILKGKMDELSEAVDENSELVDKYFGV